MTENENFRTPVDIVQTEDGYEAFCRLCEWHVLGVETLETAGHLGELHAGDEHFDV